MINAAGAHCVRSDAQKYDNPQIMYRDAGRTTKLSQHCHTIVIRIPVRSRNLRDCSCPARGGLRTIRESPSSTRITSPSCRPGKHRTACKEHRTPPRNTRASRPLPEGSCSFPNNRKRKGTAQYRNRQPTPKKDLRPAPPSATYGHRRFPSQFL